MQRSTIFEQINNSNKKASKVMSCISEYLGKSFTMPDCTKKAMILIDNAIDQYFGFSLPLDSSIFHDYFVGHDKPIVAFWGFYTLKKDVFGFDVPIHQSLEMRATSELGHVYGGIYCMMHTMYAIGIKAMKVHYKLSKLDLPSKKEWNKAMQDLYLSMSTKTTREEILDNLTDVVDHDIWLSNFLKQSPSRFPWKDMPSYMPILQRILNI
jgi:hypothetical protein